MAYTVSNHDVVGVANEGRGIFARIRRALSDHAVFVRTYHELNQLSDRELDDLGLHRSSLVTIARESVYGA